MAVARKELAWETDYIREAKCQNMFRSLAEEVGHASYDVTFCGCISLKMYAIFARIFASTPSEDRQRLVVKSTQPRTLEKS